MSVTMNYAFIITQVNLSTPVIVLSYVELTLNSRECVMSSANPNLYDSERAQCRKCLFVTFSVKTGKCPHCGDLDLEAINARHAVESVYAESVYSDS